MANKWIEKFRQLLGIKQLRWDLMGKLDRLLIEQRRFQLWEHILHDTEPGITSRRYADCDIVVSLTSFGPRLKDAAFAIESIMQQTVKANRIILWLSHDDYQQIPEALVLQQKRGLEIKECDDILSYKKLIPCLKECPNDAIVTIDDDLLYDCDILERLIMSYKETPQYISACRVHRIKYLEDGTMAPYNNWYWTISEVGPNPANFFTTGAGTLFPPDSLDKEVLNQEAFMSICKYADDIWLNAMAMKKGTLVTKVRTRSTTGEDYIINGWMQSSSLGQKNVVEKRNDDQIKAVWGKYNLPKML